MAETINIAQEFTTKPGPRYIKEGDFSGQQFRNQHLLPAFERALITKSNLIVDLNGTEGYATSFLEEAFGGLARVYDEEKVSTTLIFRCDDDPYLIEEIMQYIKEANDPEHRLAK